MVLNICVYNTRESILNLSGITLMIVTNENTCAETVVKERAYAFSDNNILTDIDQIIKTATENVAVKYIIMQTDVLTATTNKYSDKKVRKLLSKNIDSNKTALTQDYIYHLQDIDYYIFSIIDDKILKRVKEMQEYLSYLGDNKQQVCTKNQMMLSVLLKYALESANKSDFIAVGYNTQNEYTCYVSTSTGIPYRILNLKNADSVNKLIANTGIKKGIPIGCDIKNLNFESTVNVTTGNIKQSSRAIYRQIWNNNLLNFKESSTEIKLPKNSLNYKTLTSKKVGFFIKFTIVLFSLLLVGFASLLFWIKQPGNMDKAGDWAVKITAWATGLQTVPDEFADYKLLHDEFIHSAESFDLEVEDTNITQSETIDICLIFKVPTTTRSVYDFQEDLKTKNFVSDVITIKKGGNTAIVIHIDK